MRRKDREVTDRGTIDDIIRRCKICRLGMCDNGRPYVVPLSFGYDGRHIYFHAATEGKKLDIIKKNNCVCFEFDLLHEVCSAEQACNWGMKYESVIGVGRAEIVDDNTAKTEALLCIMGQYSNGQWKFLEQQLKETVVIRVAVDEIAGKVRR